MIRLKQIGDVGSVFTKNWRKIVPIVAGFAALSVAATVSAVAPGSNAWIETHIDDEFYHKEPMYLVWFGQTLQPSPSSIVKAVDISMDNVYDLDGGDDSSPDIYTKLGARGSNFSSTLIAGNEGGSGCISLDVGSNPNYDGSCNKHGIYNTGSADPDDIPSWVEFWTSILYEDSPDDVQFDTTAEIHVDRPDEPAISIAGAYCTYITDADRIELYYHGELPEDGPADVVIGATYDRYDPETNLPEGDSHSLGETNIVKDSVHQGLFYTTLNWPTFEVMQKYKLVVFLSSASQGSLGSDTIDVDCGNP